MTNRATRPAPAAKPASSGGVTAADVASADAAAAPPATPAVPAALMAFAQLGAAVAAVARFPNQPVPEKLVARITEAQANVDAAVSAGWVAPEGAAPSGEGAPAYDDAWIKTQFESLDAALKTKFEELNTSIDQRLTDLTARVTALKPASQED